MQGCVRDRDEVVPVHSLVFVTEAGGMADFVDGGAEAAAFGVHEPDGLLASDAAEIRSAGLIGRIERFGQEADEVRFRRAGRQGEDGLRVPVIDGRLDILEGLFGEARLDDVGDDAAGPEALSRHWRKVPPRKRTVGRGFGRPEVRERGGGASGLPQDHVAVVDGEAIDEFVGALDAVVEDRSRKGRGGLKGLGRGGCVRRRCWADLCEDRSRQDQPEEGEAQAVCPEGAAEARAGGHK